MNEQKSFIKGTIILAAANVISKILGAVFKIPLTYILEEEGMAIFNTASCVYSMFLTFRDSPCLLPPYFGRYRFKKRRRRHKNRNCIKKAFNTFGRSCKPGFILSFRLAGNRNERSRRRISHKNYIAFGSFCSLGQRI